jgi:hypothetical protein
MPQQTESPDTARAEGAYNFAYLDEQTKRMMKPSTISCALSATKPVSGTGRPTFTVSAAAGAIDARKPANVAAAAAWKTARRFIILLLSSAIGFPVAAARGRRCRAATGA